MSRGSSAARLVFFVALALIVFLTPAFAVRVAVIGPEAPELIASLTAALSKESGVTLLERDQLSRLIRESQISRTPPQIAAADIVVFLEILPDGQRMVRVSDSRSGAILCEFSLPKELDAVEVAEWTVLRLHPWFRSSPSPDSRKIALLGLRFETDSPANRQRERSLNLALAVALQAAPQTLVLERWKLNDLLFEKELMDRSKSPFWASASLLDGSISEKNGQLIVRFRDRMPGTGTELVGEVTGAVEDLPALATKLATLIVSRSSPDQTNRLAEAQAYANEAEWLLNHGLKMEAAQAAESAVALGLSDRPTELLRIRAYAESAYPLDLREIQSNSGGVAFPRNALTLEQISSSVAMATTMSGLVCDYARRHATLEKPRKTTLEHPVEVSTRSLLTALCTLQSAHALGYAAENPAAVRELRESISRQIAITKTLPLADPQEYRDRRGVFYHHLIHFAAYWNESPQQTLEFLDSVLSPDFASVCPNGVYLARRASNGQFTPPAIATPVESPRNYTDAPAIDFWRLIDWENLQSGTCAQLWTEFVQEKLASSDALTQADGLAFLRGSAASYNEVHALAPRFVEFFETHLADLHGPNGDAIFRQILHGLADAAEWTSPPEMRLRVVECYRKLLISGHPLPWNLVSTLGSAIPPEATEPLSNAQGRALLSAIEDYVGTLGSAVSKRDIYGIQCARSAVYRKFPSLAAQPPADALPVRQAWIAAAHTPFDPLRKQNFDGACMLWHKGRLWALNPGDHKLWCIDPDTSESELLHGINRPKAAHKCNLTEWGNNATLRNNRPLFFADKYFLPEQGDIWVYHPDTNSWRQMNLPDAHYSLWAANGKLYATFGEQKDSSFETRRGEGAGLYLLDPANESAQLIFDTRRRPALHPLDNAKCERPFCVLGGEGDSPIVGLLGLSPYRFYSKNDHTGPFYRIADGTKVKVIDPRLISNFTSVNGETLFLHTSSHDVGKSILVGIERIAPDGKQETLIWNPLNKLPAPSPPIWNFPQEPPIPREVRSTKNYRAALHHEDLYLLTYEWGQSPGGASEAILYLFRRGYSSPVRIPLDFQVSSADANLLQHFAFGSNSFQYPQTTAYGLLPLDQGLVITGDEAMLGYWFIPNADLDEWRTQNLKL